MQTLSVVLIDISLVASEAGHIFLILLATCVLSLENCLLVHLLLSLSEFFRLVFLVVLNYKCIKDCNVRFQL